MATPEDIAAVRKEVEAIVDDAVAFADASPSPERSQLLENVFPDPKGFGIARDGRYHYEHESFASGAFPSFPRMWARTDFFLACAVSPSGYANV